MEQETGKMVPGGVQAVELDIQHMRQPRQGMPIVGMKGGKSPDKAAVRDAGFDIFVFGYIRRVVIIDEVVEKKLGIDAYNEEGKDSSQQKNIPVFSGFIHTCVSLYQDFAWV